jgi:hypothetical protein
MLTDLVQQFRAPALPYAPNEYNRLYADQLNNVLRIYFNQLDTVLGELLASRGPYSVQGGGTGADAFGRLRVSEPFTLFDSQNRYQKDPHFAESTATGGSTTFVSDESTVDMDVTTSSGSKVVRQSYRVFPYQPGKGLLVLATFVMNTPKENLRQRVGYFSTDNGVFFQVNNTTTSFVLRTNTSGTPSDTRTVNQADWNGDKLDGTGPSGYTLDTSKAQILWMDFEWLGVGSVRCGFIINGEYILCHTFNNANDLNKVYMTTAILPVRYEIENTGATASASKLKQICCSVISEGGYQQKAALTWARQITATTGIGTSFVPLVSIRLKSTTLGAVVIPNGLSFMPTSASDYFEIALIKNPTLTGASFSSLSNNVEYDTAATALTGGEIVRSDYTSSGVLSSTAVNQPSDYNFALQLGVNLSGTSDIYTLAVRTISGTGDGIGALSYWDLTE